MKGLLVSLGFCFGAVLLILFLDFGTVSPCGILRAKIRQEAAREGGMGLVAAALPDSIIDGLVSVQVGSLSPGRCIALDLSGPPAQSPPTRVPHQISAAQELPPSPSTGFRQDQWDIARQQCRTQATIASQTPSGESFPNAFNRCMHARGL